MVCAVGLEVGLVFLPTPGDLPNSGIDPPSLGSPALVSGFFITEPPGKPRISKSWNESRDLEWPLMFWLLLLVGGSRSLIFK